MKEIYGFIGEIGSGKTYLSMQKIKELKYDGKTCLVIAWADPIKEILAEHFGLLKSGWADDSDSGREFLATIPMEDLASVFSVSIYKYLTKFCPNVPIFKYEIDQIIYAQFTKYCRKISGIIQGLFEDPENYSDYYRRLIQFVGTELGREVYNDIWIEITIGKINFAFENDLCQAVIIDDIRFFNEFNALKNYSEEENYKVKFTGVIAPLCVRSNRTGVSMDALRKQATHSSEIYIDKILEEIPQENIVLND